jgi:hypothetical protein
MLGLIGASEDECGGGGGDEGGAPVIDGEPDKQMQFAQ